MTDLFGRTDIKEKALMFAINLLMHSNGAIKIILPPSCQFCIIYSSIMESPDIITEFTDRDLQYFIKKYNAILDR
jgi:hypothetical protein